MEGDPSRRVLAPQQEGSGPQISASSCKPVNSESLWVFIPSFHLPEPASSPVSWRFWTYEDLSVNVGASPPTSCPPPPLYCRCPSAFQGLCVFWRGGNNNSGSGAPISIYHPELLTQVLQRREMSR